MQNETVLELLIVTLVASATVAATGIGALPVIAAGHRAAAMQPFLNGVAAGVMSVAAIVGLLIPAVRDGSPGSVAGGVVAGVALVWWARHSLRAHAGQDDTQRTRAELTFGVLFAHSLPEGLALGCALAAGGAQGTFVVLAVAIQNIPEGTAVAIALQRSGESRWRQLVAAVASSVPQVPGAVVAWLAVDAVQGLLAVSFAVAGAAMLWLVVSDLVPASWIPGARLRVSAGGVAGAAVMCALALLL